MNQDLSNVLATLNKEAKDNSIDSPVIPTKVSSKLYQLASLNLVRKQRSASDNKSCREDEILSSLSSNATDSWISSHSAAD